MKRFKILAVVIITFFTINAAKAQVGVHVGLNFGAPYHRVYAPAPPPVYDGYYRPGYYAPVRGYYAPRMAYAPRVVYGRRYYATPGRYYRPFPHRGYYRPYRRW
ncbi:hypothetical protein [Mucilaginibacter sp.]